MIEFERSNFQTILRAHMDPLPRRLNLALEN